MKFSFILGFSDSSNFWRPHGLPLVVPSSNAPDFSSASCGSAYWSPNFDIDFPIHSYLIFAGISVHLQGIFQQTMFDY